MPIYFSRRFDEFAAWLVLATGISVFALVFVHAMWYAPEAQSAEPAVAASSTLPIAAASPGVPVRLAIPALGIDANVQRVGISYAGNVMVPSNFTDVAWYRGSADPGAPGTAVVDGHVDNGLGLAGVFKKLGKIELGDDIYVDEASGTEHFVVSAIDTYPMNEVPMAAILGQEVQPELVLITCEGAWVQGSRTYDHRLVVYADLAGTTGALHS